ncbi:hypothetical protein SNEBB_010223 [Seison nebaliae]|nr:hypothetical protein SNEBB_010223 [Seison nebaliae]
MFATLRKHMEQMILMPMTLRPHDSVLEIIVVSGLTAIGLTTFLIIGGCIFLHYQENQYKLARKSLTDMAIQFHQLEKHIHHTHPCMELPYDMVGVQCAVEH